MTQSRDLPESWVWARFGDVAAVESNLVDPSKHQEAVHIAPNHIESRTGVLLPYTTIRADKVISANHLFRPGQIIYSKIRPYLAKAILVDFPGLCSADMYPVASSIEPSYLHRWLISPEFTDLASQVQGRTVLPKINQDALVELPVPVPPLAEQRRISNKLERAVSHGRRAKEALDAIPALLERFRQSVLASAFRGDLTAAWREKNPDVEPAEELLTRIRAERRRRWEEAELAKMRAKGKVPGDDRWKDKYEEPAPVDASELPELPEGWCWSSLDEILLNLRNGIADKPDRETGLRILRISAVRSLSVNLKDVRFLETRSGYDDYLLNEGDVLLTRYNGNPEFVGVAAVVRGVQDRVVYPDKLIRVQCVPDLVNPDFLALVLNTGCSRAHIASKCKTAAGQVGISGSDLRNTPIPIASVDEQHEVARRANKLLRSTGSMTRLLSELIKNCTDLDRAILAKAFRGELVPQDPTDEPASVLLERLRAEAEQNGKPTPGAARRRAAASPPPAQPDNTHAAKKPQAQASRRGQGPARSRG